jgi:hypothetical protein
MATAGGRGAARYRGEQLFRETWQAVGRRTSAGTARPWNFLVACPPLVQGVYFLLTGAWPLIDIDSFQAVTGPKTDLWLVRTVGMLILVIGPALCVAAYHRPWSPEVLVVAVGSAGALAVVNVVYVARGTIAPIYLLDAVVEAGLIGLWSYGWRTTRQKPATPVAAPGTGAKKT